MDLDKLVGTATDMVASGKGLLAADESTGTIKKRFDSINVESTEKNRLSYREMLFRTEGISKFLSGVILYDETLRQRSALDGSPLVEILQKQGIIPGVKVDKSTNRLSGTLNELTTDGLDGLRGRLTEYYQLGARFTKWRAVITIGDNIPTDYCIEVNAHLLARFAALSQEANMVPIVEPEVLMDGNHTIDQCFSVTEATLKEVYAQLSRQGVSLEGSLLKPNMVLSGKQAGDRADMYEVAEKTLTCLMRTVPAAVPGIVFLSGGQDDEEATVNLNAINQLAEKIGAPWELAFSYGRSLQSAPLEVWLGKEANLAKASAVFYGRARATSSARMGEYSPILEKNMVVS